MAGQLRLTGGGRLRRRGLPVRHGGAADAVRPLPAGALRVRRPGLPGRHPARLLPMREVLPDAFGPADLPDRGADHRSEPGSGSGAAARSGMTIMRPPTRPLDPPGILTLLIHEHRRTRVPDDVRASARWTSSPPSGTAGGCPTSRSTGWSPPTPAARSPTSRWPRWPWPSCSTAWTPRRSARWTQAMIDSGEVLSLRRRRAADRGQALDRRGRRQDHAAAGAAGRGVRGGGAAAVRPRARPHRRHAGQAGVDPGLAGVAVAGGDRGAARRRRRGDLRDHPDAGARPTASSTRCATSPARSSRSR